MKLHIKIYSMKTDIYRVNSNQLSVYALYYLLILLIFNDTVFWVLICCIFVSLPSLALFLSLFHTNTRRRVHLNIY